jgi:tetratricopeptide (TPR) repeat protein
MLCADRLPAAERRAAIELALTEGRVVPALDRPLARAIARLAEEGGGGAILREATRLAIRAADLVGPDAQHLRRLGRELADRSGVPALRRALLERQLPELTSEGSKLFLLRTIARLFHEEGDLAGEARTLVRVLATARHDLATLDRLIEIYTETGEQTRLMATLTLRGELMEGPERLDLALRRAAIAAEVGRDPEEAVRALEAADSGDPEDLRGLFKLAGGLLALGRPVAAFELLRDRAEEASEATAALIYEHAIGVAERFELPEEEALAVALRGLLRAPRSSVLLMSLERFALHLGAVEAAEEAYSRALDAAMGPNSRRALLYRKARWLERADRKELALSAYLSAYRNAPARGAIRTRLLRLAEELGDEETIGEAERLLDN